MPKRKRASSKTVQKKIEKSSKLAKTLEKTVTPTVLKFKKADRLIVTDSYHENKHVDLPDTSAQIKQKQFGIFLDDFKSWLKREMKNCCNFDCVAEMDKPVDIVPLQITTNVQNQQFDGPDWKERMFLENQFSKKNNQPVGNVLLEDLFTKSKKHATKLAKGKTFTYCEAKDRFINRVGSIVGILGGAGMGKTTLMKQLLKQVVNENTHLYDAEYVFYLQFRNLNYKTKTSFLHFLAPESIPLQFVKNKTMMNMLLKELNENDNICLIMDGFDEADIRTDFARPTKIDIYDVAFAEDFIQNLFQGKILPKAKKIISSRPGQLFEIHKESRPKFVVNILGLDRDAQVQICENVCGDNSKQVFSVIEENTDLSNICCVPFNCIMVCRCINVILYHNEHEQLSNGSTLPGNSLTIVLAIVNCRFMKSNHVREKLEPSKLATLAWRGLQQNKVQFDENDMREVGLESVNMSDHLNTICGMNELPLLEGLETKYIYFSHKILQEYYAALKILLYMSFDGFVKLLCTDTNQLNFGIFSSRYENVIKFLCGLCNKNTFEYLKQSVSPCIYPFKQQEKLKELLIQETESFFCPSLLKVFHFVYEMHNDDLSKKIAERLNSHISISVRLSTKDVIAFLYVLQFRKSLLTLHINEYSLHGKAFTMFVHRMNFVFSKIPLVITDMHQYLLCTRNHDPEMIDEWHETILTSTRNLVRAHPEPLCSIKFKYYGNGVIDCKLISQCICKINKFHLENCKDQAINISSLFDALHILPKPLKKLNLSGTSIGNKGAVALSSCLHNIEELILSDCEIYSEGVQSLVKAVEKLRAPIKVFDISCNPFDDSALLFFTTTCLENIENLSLMDLGGHFLPYHYRLFSVNLKHSKFVGLKHLLNKIEKLSKPLNELKVTLKDGADNLFSTRSIQNIRNLYLGRHLFNEEDDIGLSNMIRNLAQPLNRLVLVANFKKMVKIGKFKKTKLNIEDDNEKKTDKENTQFLLCNCLHNINEIILINYKTTPTAMNVLVNEIQSRSTPLKCFELHHCFDTCITKEEDMFHEEMRLFKCVDMLGICLSNIEELVLFQCNLDNEAVASLSSSIKLLKKSMKLLDMEDENLDVTSLKIVCSSLSNIEKLYFSCLNFVKDFYVSDGIDVLTEAVNNLAKPMELLYIEDRARLNSQVISVVRKLKDYRNKIKMVVLNKQVIFACEEIDFSATIRKRSDVILKTTREHFKAVVPSLFF